MRPKQWSFCLPAVIRSADSAVLALCVLVVMSGCLDPLLGLPPVPEAQALVPAAEYQQWYREMEQCSGRRGEYDRIVWYTVPDGKLGEQIMARWDAPHTIQLTEFVVRVTLARTIKHEMLHDLLQSGEHPQVFDTCEVR